MEEEELSQEWDGPNDLGWNNTIHCSVYVREISSPLYVSFFTHSLAR